MKVICESCKKAVSGFEKSAFFVVTPGDDGVKITQIDDDSLDFMVYSLCAWCRNPGNNAAKIRGNVLDKKVDKLAFGLRVRKALSSLEVDTYRDLVALDSMELMACRHFGVTSLCEVREHLGELGLALKGESA